MKTKGIRITKLLLKNYAPFYESMGIKIFEFDRTKSSNKLVLILGANGAGKSFILTELSPEPTEHINGRTTNRYIENEEGRKELTYMVSDENGLDTDEYKCTIIYAADRRKTVCYFTRTNLLTGETEELNQNGNVSSYMDCCKKYLGYEKNYKNIGYLSGDVKNLVSMSFTERQQLISNWLPNTSEFLQAGKQAQKKLNQTKREIDNLLKDIAKIATGDVENLKKQEEEKLIVKKAKLDKIKDGLSKANLMMSMLTRYNRLDLNNKKNQYILDVRAHNDRFNKNSEQIKKYNAYLKGEAGRIKLAKDISDLEAKQEKLIESESSINDEIVRLTSQIESMNISENTGTGNYDLVSVTESINKNKSDLDIVNNAIADTLKAHEDYGVFNEYKSEMKLAASATINALMNIALISNKISSMCGNYEFKQIFDSEVGKDIESQIATLKNTNELMNKQIVDLETSLREEEEHSVNFASLKPHIPSGCSEHTCALIKVLLERAADNASSKISLTRQKIDEIKKNVSNNQAQIEEKQLVRQNLSNALFDMAQVTDILKTLDDKTFYLPSSIRDEINSPIAYNVLVKTSLLLDMVKNYDEYVSCLERKQTLLQTINNLSNISHILTLSEESKRVLQANIDRRKECSDKLKNVIIEKEKVSAEKESLFKLSDQIIKLKEERDSLVNEYCSLESRKESLLKENEYVYNATIITACVRKLRDLEMSLNKDVIDIQNKIEGYKTQITSVEVLKNRKTILDDRRDLYELAYKIWSAEGYPSLLINDFLEEVTECTNADLDESWGGMLNIQKPILDSTALKVPVVRGNKTLADVSECSKAERSTMDLALSFGILEVSLENSLYSIIRLDECDGGMDQIRRQTFLEVLLNRMNKINCQNAFCVTHSNCFDGVEADVILLKGYESMISDASLFNKNIIYRYDKSI